MILTHWLLRLDYRCLGFYSTLLNRVYVDVDLNCWCLFEQNVAR